MVKSCHTLVVELRPFVRASLRRLGVPSVGLDDAEQEVFLVVVRRRADYDPHRGVSERGWVWGICRNVARAQRRHDRRARLGRPVPDLEHHAPLDARLDAQAGLDALDEEGRALWLARCEGRSAAELAASLELPLTTVQWRLRQAKRRMHAFARGLAQHANALVAGLLRPARGASVLVTSLGFAAMLAPSPAEPRSRSSEAPPPASPPPALHVRATTRLTPRTPPPPRPRVRALDPQVHGERPAPRRRKPGRVSLGTPSVHEG